MEKCGLPLALSFQDAGHSVRTWMAPERGGRRCEIGDGMIEKVAEWKPSMKWADIILMTDNNHYQAEIEPFFTQGYPIIGANQEAAAWELDRVVGQEVMAECGLEILDYEEFSSYDKAIAYVKKESKPFVSKPWGGSSDKNLSYVPKSAENLVSRLEKWKQEGVKGKFLLQEMVEGQEMAVGAWFGPGGFSRWINENWEEKRFMAGGYGPNTGEMGTILRYTKKSKLFTEVMKPLEERLHEVGYVGYVDVNCIVSDGVPWPLEFTMRFGWPHINIAMYLHKGDPLDWMAGLLEGKDTLDCSTDIACGVVMSLGDYPWDTWERDKTHGWPIRGLSPSVRKQTSLSSVMLGEAPVMLGGRVQTRETLVTAGEYVMIVNGKGSSVEAARTDCYAMVDSIDWPPHKNLRTDIGCRLEEDLPLLQKQGYAEGMSYGP